VFIVGSSQVGVLNSTFINEYVSKSHPRVIVYNIAEAADTPLRRASALNDIESAKPSLLVYGIGYRDFLEKTTVATPLPDVHQIFNNLFTIGNTNSVVLQNPKLITLEAIREFSEKNSEFSNNLFRDTRGFQAYTPFFPINVTEVSIINNEPDLSRLDLPPSDFHITMPDENEQLKSLDFMIDELQHKNIKVVIIAVPHYKAYLESLQSTDIQNFDLILQHLSKKHGVTIYDLNEKYSNQNIWHTSTHVALNKKSIIYSEDVAKMINQEIK